MKSSEARQDFAEILRHVRQGGTVIVEHYNESIARLIPEDDTVVILKAPSVNEAEQLRRLVREHRALGIPFPNNTLPYRVVNEDGKPADPHTIPSISVELA